MGLFNGLQPIQIKNPDSLFQTVRLAFRLQELRARPFSSVARKRHCDPTISNEYHRFRLMAIFWEALMALAIAGHCAPSTFRFFVMAGLEPAIHENTEPCDQGTDDVT